MSLERQRRTFLSYSRVNQDFALKLAEELKSAGFPVFFDQLDIPTGARWDDELEKALDACEIFMVILTPSSSASENVKDEISFAIDHGKRILPVLLKDSKLPLRLRRFQYVDFTTKSFDEGIESAKNLLRNLSEEPTTPRTNLPADVQGQMAREKAEADQIAWSKSIPAMSAEEQPAALKSARRKLSRRTIIIGAVASLLILIGIVVVAVFLMRDQPAPITSAGMLNVPAGNYTISTDTPVELPEFWIDRYEITNANYAKFLTETQNNPPEYWGNGDIPAGQRNHPVRQVTWDQAQAYCAWVGKRLPTETEWEVAARGPFNWLYPWGNDSEKVKQETKSTRPVDSNPANRSYFGAYYMSGNVWEWVSNPNTPTAEGEQVLRGGAFGPRDVLTTAVSVADDIRSIEKAGFRCAASGENVESQYDDNLALDDSFESNNTNWPGIHDENFLFDYHEDGFYHLEARESNKFIPAFYEHESFNNFVVETGVFVDKANTDNQQGNYLYGLGIQISDEQFYAFVVSARDQTWQVLRGTLNPDTWIGDASELTVIKSGTDRSILGASEGEEDRLAVIANDTELMYYVNGNLVYRVNVEDLQKVKVGFFVETLDDVAKVHLHFNWITLQTIEAFDSGGEIQKPATPTATPTVEKPSVTPTPVPSPTVEQPSATAAPTLTPTTEQPSATPTFSPPVIPYVRILEITTDAQQKYVVEYETFGYTEQLPGTHIHFFFDTVAPEQAGSPGSGPWIVYGGPRPFTKYTVNNRPAGAMQICALVANSNHSVQANSGNCLDLP